MKWWGRKAGAAPRPALLSGLGIGSWPGAAEAVPRSYEAQVREAFLGNPVAQRAVRLVAEGVAGCSVYADEANAPPPPVSADGSGGRSSSPFRGGFVSASLLETIAAHLLLHGNAFVQCLQDGEGRLAQLFALRPERVRVEADAGGWPAAYLYKVGDAKLRVPVRDGLGRPGLVHLRALNPLDDHYGLGCLGAAAGAVAIHNQATRFHNEAISAVDALLHPAVEGEPIAMPPDAPLPGQCWLVGGGANGAWAGKEGRLAAWTSGGWRFAAPQPGMCVWDKSGAIHRRWTGSAWSGGEIAASALKIGGLQVVGARQPSISAPVAGTVVDQEARTAISTLIVTLRTHGLIE